MDEEVKLMRKELVFLAKEWNNTAIEKHNLGLKKICLLFTVIPVYSNKKPRTRYFTF